MLTSWDQDGLLEEEHIIRENEMLNAPVSLAVHQGVILSRIHQI